MREEKDVLFSRLCLQKGYLKPQEVETAFEDQQVLGQRGIKQDISEILVGKDLISQKQRSEINHLVEIQTGEARIVADFEVVEKIGEGGFGVVYRAMSLKTGGWAALKILPPDLARDKEFVDRFQREMQVLRSLDHPNIVRCIDAGLDRNKNVYYCAMEFVEGETLYEKLAREGVLDEREALQITRQIAMALQHAHFKKLVHRDIKPSNIMTKLDGTAMLLDFGTARDIAQDQTFLTISGAFLGSPRYASPEQARGLRDLDVRSDIYSLGATLYHMVTGEVPFDGMTAPEIIAKHITEELPWPANINPDLSERTCELIEKMMVKDREDRYANPKQLLADLSAVLDGHEMTARMVDPGRSTISRTLKVRQRRHIAAVTAQIKKPRLKPDRKPVLIGAALLFAVLVGVVALMVWYLAGLQTPGTVFAFWRIPRKPPVRAAGDTLTLVDFDGAAASIEQVTKPHMARRRDSLGDGMMVVEKAEGHSRKAGLYLRLRKPADLSACRQLSFLAAAGPVGTQVTLALDTGDATPVLTTPQNETRVDIGPEWKEHYLLLKGNLESVRGILVVFNTGGGKEASTFAADDFVALGRREAGEPLAAREPAPLAPPVATASTVGEERGWRRVFDGRTLDCLEPGTLGSWRVKDGAIEAVPALGGARAQTKEEFEDGRICIRFTTNDVKYLSISARVGPKGACSGEFYADLLQAMEGNPHELVFTCRGEQVSAELDGEPKLLRLRGDPRSGRLQFYTEGGRLRILSIDYSERLTITSPTVPLAPVPPVPRPVPVGPTPTPPSGQVLRSEWVSIFNGRDMTGWRALGGKSYVENGALVSKDAADLYYPADWEEFELECEIAGGGPSTAYPFASLALAQHRTGRGNCRLRIGFFTSGHMDLKQGDERIWTSAPATFPRGRWGAVRVALTRNALKMEVDGKLVANVGVSQVPAAKGGIYFYSNNQGWEARIRNVRVKVLSGTPPKAPAPPVKPAETRTPAAPVKPAETRPAAPPLLPQTAPEAPAAKSLPALLDEFDTLMSKRECKQARELVEREADVVGSAKAARTLNAAARVAGALCARREAARRGLLKSLGQEARLRTSGGEQKGVVQRATEDEIVLMVAETRRGRLISSRLTITWAELLPEEEARLAKDWQPTDEDDAIASVYLALQRKDAATALKAVDSAKGHPLAEHLRGRIRGLAAAAVEPTAESRPAPGETEGRPPDRQAVQRLFLGEVRSFNAADMRTEIVYDFEDPRQLSDWSLSDWALGGKRGGRLAIEGGALLLAGTNQCALVKGVFVEVQVQANILSIGGGEGNAALLACADGNGDFHGLFALKDWNNSHLFRYGKGTMYRLGVVEFSSIAKDRRGLVMLDAAGDRLVGRVPGGGSLRRDRALLKPGRVGVWAPGSQLVVGSFYVSGTLDSGWLRNALVEPEGAGARPR